MCAIYTHDVGTPSEGSRGCSRRRSTATLGRRPARRSFARRCSCWAGPCPKRVLTPSRLENSHIVFTQFYYIIQCIVYIC